MKIIPVADLDPSPENFKLLEDSINTAGENACRDKLLHFCHSLAYKHDIRLEYVITELVMIGGSRGDLLLCGVPSSFPEGYEMCLQKDVILYEAKTPKCNILQNCPDKKDMLIESQKLTSAFGQLRNYMHNLNQDRTWLNHQINTGFTTLQKGGVIIGKALPNEPDKQLALRLIQEERKAKVYSWTQILQDIRSYYFHS